MAKKPRLTVLQPETDVPLDRFEQWLEPHVRMSLIDLSSKDLPQLNAIGDGLVVLGGRMSAHDEHRWIEPAKDLLADATEIGIPVLGICLGHQLLAEALGGEVSVGDPRGLEEGAVQLTWAPQAEDDPVFAGAAAAGGPVPMSHYDAVTTLPPGSVEMAVSPTYPAAAFRLGTAWGVQFHPEASPELMQHWWSLKGHKGTTMLDRMRQVDDRVAPTCQAIAEGFARVVRED